MEAIEIIIINFFMTFFGGVILFNYFHGMFKAQADLIDRMLNVLSRNNLEENISEASEKIETTWLFTIPEIDEEE